MLISCMTISGRTLKPKGDIIGGSLQETAKEVLMAGGCSFFVAPSQSGVESKISKHMFKDFIGEESLSPLKCYNINFE